ncbi:Pr6Pr family membrane protein [soil metagenome]
MDKQESAASKIFLFIIALLGWFALIAQGYINFTSNVAPLPELIIRYFSYFTLLTNLLVAVCCTTLLLQPNSKLAAFFSKQNTLTAITVYIVIVGFIYNTILRFLWKPEGLQMIVDELLHSVIPALFLIYWLVFIPKFKLQWNSFFPWLIYPLLYIIYILIRGAFSGFYPYPFINAAAIGLKQAIINSVGIAMAFMLVSLIFISIGKRMKN